MANDPLTEQIAAYVQAGRAPSPAALEVAWLALFDALGCAMAATRVPECLRLIAPLVPCTVAQGGIPIVGTAYIAGFRFAIERPEGFPMVGQ